jgi:hypothetical protein
MNPYYLEGLYQRLGRPRWFWPVVFFILFLGLVLAGSIAP